MKVTLLADPNASGNISSLNLSSVRFLASSFYLDPSTGRLFLDPSAPLQPVVYQLDVVGNASDASGAWSKSNTRVVVHAPTGLGRTSSKTRAMSRNTNRPEFKNCSTYAPTVEEEKRIGTFVFKTPYDEKGFFLVLLSVYPPRRRRWWDIEGPSSVRLCFLNES
ncbi:unnamed protein product [Cyprideis torosa]|uniref:Uncharacterized protein n=1 Tax=Cyprideis torosa TaxID=163714 RepID=A0A7R8WLA7_9CRUS|nr:unnamed protein product [Cyprideis torosa]CAG0897872.1 unnamed protein product [Cyprideis torosa]